MTASRDLDTLGAAKTWTRNFGRGAVGLATPLRGAGTIPSVIAGRIKLYYERLGTGPSLIFISGLGGDHHLWIPVAERLRDRYDCITFDNRGIGQSSRPRSGYTIPDLARDTLALLEKLSISQTHILGMSMGGMIALSVALQRPDIVGGLILAGSLAAPDPRLMQALNSRKIMQRRMSRYDYFWALAAWMFSPSALQDPGYAESFARRAAENPNPQSLSAFDQLVDGIGEFDARASLREIRLPTLVMVGEQDILTPPHLSQVLAEGISGAEYEVLPGLGHFSPTESPDVFADCIAGFLARVDAS